MMKKIKTQLLEYKISYLCLFFALLLLTGGFLYNRYAVDTYFLEGYGYQNNAFFPYFRDGRLFMTLFLEIMAKLHISFSACKMLSCLLAICSLYLSILVFYHLFLQNHKKSKALAAFLSFFLVVNIFIVEFFMFPEYTGIMCFSIFLISMATKMMVNYFRKREKKYIAFASLFSFFTAFCYQGSLSLLVLFPILFTLYYGKDIKTFIQNNLVIALCYLIPSVTTLMVSKLLGSTRTSKGFNLSLAVSKIYDGTKSMIGTTFGILPDYMFVVFTVLFSVVVLFVLVHKKEKLEKYLFFFYVMLAVVVVTLVPHFLIDANSIWVVPRSNIGLGLLVVVPLAIYFLYLSKIPKVTYFFVTFFTIFFVFQFQGWHQLLFDQIKVNALDGQEARNVISQIDQYEEKEEPIQKIAFYKGDNPEYQYDGIRAQGDMNIRALATDWTASSLISTYLDRGLTQVEFSKEMNQRCQKHKEESNKTTVFFQDDIVYLCSY